MTQYRTRLLILLMRYHRWFKSLNLKKGCTFMKLRLQRLHYREHYTIGKLYLDDFYICDTLEDTYRDLDTQEKVPHQTAIPAGLYAVAYSFSHNFEVVLPEILKVPHFTGIRIHSGNTDADTSGCILVGSNKRRGALINSRAKFKTLCKLLKRCENVTLEVKL